MMRKSDGFFGAMQMLWWLFLVGMAVKWLAFRQNNSFEFWSAYVIVLICIVCVIGLWISHLESKKKQRALHAPCPHGVNGGYTLHLCENCQRDEERRRFLVTLSNDALALQTKELKRLYTARLNQLSNLLQLSPQKFEDAIAGMFTIFGYTVEQTPYSNDGGKDAIMQRDGNKYLVECKRYTDDNPIGRPMLQKFFAALIEENANCGFFVTTGRFTSTAVTYAEANNITLVDGQALTAMMSKAYPREGDATSTKVMCRECGDIVDFIVSDEETDLICKNGHVVRCTITNEGVLKSGQTTPHRRVRRSRKRYNSNGRSKHTVR